MCITKKRFSLVFTSVFACGAVASFTLFYWRLEPHAASSPPYSNPWRFFACKMSRTSLHAAVQYNIEKPHEVTCGFSFNLHQKPLKLTYEPNKIDILILEKSFRAIWNNEFLILGAKLILSHVEGMLLKNVIFAKRQVEQIVYE